MCDILNTDVDAIFTGVYIIFMPIFTPTPAYTHPCSKLNFKSPALNGLSQRPVEDFYFDALRCRCDPFQ